MKKISSLLLTIIFLFSYALPALAVSSEKYDGQSKKYEILMEKKIEEDKNKLLERAKAGITDDPSDLNPETAILINDETKEETKIPVLKTTQMYKKVKLSDGTISEYYVTDSFSAFAITPLGIIPSFQDDDWDVTGGFYAWGRVSYTKSYLNGYDTVRLYQGEGGWEDHDPTGSISNMNVKYGQSGQRADNNKPFETWLDKKPSSSTFSYYAPDNWPELRKDITFGLQMGETLSATCSAQGSTWNFKVTINKKSNW